MKKGFKNTLTKKIISIKYFKTGINEFLKF